MPDLDSLDWKSFRDLATPEQAARVLREWYGEGAAEAAASCAAAALADNRYTDYRFWMAVGQAIAPDRTTAAGHDNALSNQPSADELLRLIHEFARIADPNVRDFAVNQVKAVAERRVVPLRGKRS